MRSEVPELEALQARTGAPPQQIQAAAAGVPGLTRSQAIIQAGAEVLEHCRKLTSEVAPELLELV